MGVNDPAPGIDVPKVVVGETPQRGEPSVMKIPTIGLDLDKQWFQVDGVDACGQDARGLIELRQIVASQRDHNHPN
jgi:hypothetical protein